MVIRLLTTAECPGRADEAVYRQIQVEKSISPLVWIIRHQLAGKKVHKYYIFLDDSSWNYPQKMLHECMQNEWTREQETVIFKKTAARWWANLEGVPLCYWVFMCQADLSSWYRLKAPDDDRQLYVSMSERTEWEVGMRNKPKDWACERVLCLSEL